MSEEVNLLPDWVLEHIIEVSEERAAAVQRAELDGMPGAEEYVQENMDLAIDARRMLNERRGD